MIGIFGGTFDPIHYGHLRPVTEVADALGLQQVRFVPAAAPPHRPPPIASAADRLRMVELAVAGRAVFRVDDRELRRSGPSYTVDTLTSLRAELGATPFGLIIGMDAFLGLSTWHRWEALPSLAHLIVMQRPGWELLGGGVPAWARDRVASEAAALRRQPSGYVWLQAVTPQSISASAIRAALAQGESVDALLPAPVLDYILAHHLYPTLKEHDAGKENAATR
jgi:nicotinate-nucleotide adenylyltransferase